MFVYCLVHSIISSFSTECCSFGPMSGGIGEETTVILYCSKAAEHKWQQIAKGHKKRSYKEIHVCCPGEINSFAVLDSDFLCNAKPDFS